MIYFYLPITGLTALLGFSLAAFVYFHKPHTSIKIRWSLFSCTTSFWSLGYFISLISSTHPFSLVSSRISHAWGALIPVTFLHFVLALLSLEEKQKRFLFLSYVCSFTLAAFSLTPLVVKDVITKQGIRFYPEWGLLYTAYSLTYLILIGYSWFLMIKAISRLKGLERLRIIYLFTASALGFAGGMSLFLLIFNIPFPPYGSMLIALYPIIMSYSIVQHRLMDMEVIVKKTLVFGALFSLVFGIVTIVTVFSKQYFEKFFGWGESGALALSAILIILIMRPLQEFLVRITDKYLFQKKFDYKHMIRQFMDELKSMNLNPQDIAKSTNDFFEMSLRPESAAIFMLNQFTNKYDLIAQSSTSKIGGSGAHFSEIKNIGKIVDLKKDTNMPADERKSLLSLGVVLLVPLMIRKELLGLICLGPKKSGEDYAVEDLETLADLSGALAIAMNNAQLFEQQADAEKRAMIGTLATGINHEIGNPLNIIQVALQSFQILQREGLLKEKSKEEILNDLSSMTDRCLDAAGRITAITKEISEFAKPDKKLTYDKVDVEDAINHTVAVLDHDMNLNHISFEKRINCCGPWIMADRGQVTQIFFNLIRNAAQAINKPDGKIEIEVTADTTNKEVCISIKDNGMGIAKENLKKLFSPFFTTKVPGKGTGLGLTMVKMAAERNNGRIGVESEEGKGTTFTVTFKGGQKDER